MTGCSRAADWQALGLYHSFLRSGQPGRFVRIAACLPGEGAPTDLVPTWKTEGIVDVGGIVYPLFNKPWALHMYMKRARVTEDFILVLDSDMLIRRPMLPAAFGVSEIQAASENMWYLDDLNAVLVPEMMPDLPTKADNECNPGPGRQADEVGEFYFMHRKQWEMVASQWYQHTLPVMQNMLHRPQLWQKRNLTRTTAWYGEMYAYGLATAEAGVNHLGSSSTVFHMRYYHPHGNPHLMHYAWSARVSSLPWEWDKHKYQAFQAEACPQMPWSSNQGLFPHPPLPSELTSKGGDLIKDLLNIEVVATLNHAFCSLHHSLDRCSNATYAHTQCAKVEQSMEELSHAWRKLQEQPGGIDCIDMLPEGECRKDRCELKRMKYSAIKSYCRRTCDYCEEV
ncbi:g9694 [Coccomyxa viridis]|uniref:G9694 protein n=1 Tax=Coccomyxa viridis TaxID=1274662 RepID=A0ABP1G6A5_9CHLO